MYTSYAIHTGSVLHLKQFNSSYIPPCHAQSPTLAASASSVQPKLGQPLHNHQTLQYRTHQFNTLPLGPRPTYRQTQWDRSNQTTYNFTQTLLTTKCCETKVGEKLFNTNKLIQFGIFFKNIRIFLLNWPIQSISRNSHGTTVAKKLCHF